MAETYKGLTIRIGGDVSGLSKALHSVTSAARSTESQLRKMGQALKLDPGSTEAQAEQVGAIARRAMESASRLATLRTAVRQTGDAVSKLDGRTIKELSDSTDDAALAAERAKEQYNAVNAALEAYNLQAMDKTGFDLREVNAEEFEVVIAEMKELGEWTDRDVERIAHLKDSWHEASDTLTLTKQVAQFKDLEVEVAKTDAEMGNYVTRMNQVDGSKLSATFEATDQKLVKIGARLQVAEEAFAQLDQAMQLDPGNIELAEQHSESLSIVLEGVARKAHLLYDKLDAYKAAGIDTAGKSVEKLGEEADSARANFVQLQREVEETRGEIENLTAKSKEMELLGKTDTDEYRELQRQLSIATDRLDELKSSADGARTALDTAEARHEMAQLEQEIDETVTHYHELEDAGRQASDALSTTLRGNALAAAQELGQALDTYVTQPLLRIAENSLEAGRSIDSSFRDMRKTVDATEEEYESLRDAAIEFSTTHVTSADQMLEFEALAGQIGIANENLQSYAEVIAQLETATDIEGADAALKVGQMANVMSDLDGGNVNQFADALVRLGNNMPATESTIMQIAQRLSSVGSIAGMTTPEVLAWASAIASTGQRSEAAATAINNTMQGISLAVANGGDKLEQYASRAGMSAQEFADMWRGDPTAALRAWIDGLAAADAAGEDLYAVLDEVGISGVRQTQAIAGLTQTIDNLDTAMTMSNDAWNGVDDKWGAAGDAAREADRKAEGLSGTLSKLENAAQVVGSEIAEGMVPFLELASGAMSNLAKFMSELPRPAKVAVVAIGGIAAAAGPLLLISSGIIEAVGTVSGAIGAFKAAASAGVGVIGKLASTFGALAAPATLASVAIGALAAVAVGGLVMHFVNAKRELDHFTDSVGSMRDSADTIAESLEPGRREVEELGAAAEDSAMNITELTDAVGDHNSRMAEIAKPAAETIGTLGEYQEIIDAFWGQRNVSDSDFALLQWAVDGLNESLGTTISANDVLLGCYEDEQGAIHTTVDDLDRLIEKRQEEAQVAATTELYQEAYKNRLEMAHNLSRAEEEYNTQLEQVAQGYERMGMSAEEAHDTAVAFLEGTEVEQNLRAAEEALDSATEECREWEEEMNNAAAASVESADDIKAYIQSVSNLESALYHAGVNTDEFSQALIDAGMSTDTLRELGSDNLAALAEACNGDIDSMISAIQLFNGTSIDPETGEVVVEFGTLTDAQDAVYTWNGTELVDQDGNVVVDDVELTDALGNVYQWNGSSLKSLSTKVTVDTSQAERETLDFIRRMQNKTITLRTQTTGSTRTNTVMTPQVMATGGHIPRHADGFIATSATMTNYGWIGEAGAEAYTGNSVIPLTNTKYSQPFVDLIADGVSKRLGSTSPATSYNFTFDDVRVNDNAAMRAAVERFMDDIMRAGGMYGGH